jgi:hypothetical protein
MDPLEELMLRAYPNPTRTGCPGFQMLRSMAAKTVSRSDPAWEHLWKCSPCFGEFVKLRDARMARERLKQIMIWGSLAAILLIALTLGAHRFIPSRYSGGPGTQRPHRYQAAVFNFEGADDERVLRGTETPPPERLSPKDQRLPARIVDLTVYLAGGSDDGEYQLQFLDGHNTVLASAEARAQIDKGRTHYTAVVDLSKFAPGEYAVRSRKWPNGSWYRSMVIVE